MERSARRSDLPGRYRRAWLLAERTAWTVGLVCLGTWGALRIEGATGARHEPERFATLQAATGKETLYRTSVSGTPTASRRGGAP